MQFAARSGGFGGGGLGECTVIGVKEAVLWDLCCWSEREMGKQFLLQKSIFSSRKEKEGRVLSIFLITVHKTAVMCVGNRKQPAAGFVADRSGNYPWQEHITFAWLRCRDFSDWLFWLDWICDKWLFSLLDIVKTSHIGQGNSILIERSMLW